MHIKKILLLALCASCSAYTGGGDELAQPKKENTFRPLSFIDSRSSALLSSCGVPQSPCAYTPGRFSRGFFSQSPTGNVSGGASSSPQGMTSGGANTEESCSPESPDVSSFTRSTPSFDMEQKDEKDEASYPPYFATVDIDSSAGGLPEGFYNDKHVVDVKALLEMHLYTPSSLRRGLKKAIYAKATKVAALIEACAIKEELAQLCYNVECMTCGADNSDSSDDDQ